MIVVARGITSSRKRQRGVALAIVVWFIAGMSLLVAGIVAHARIDTKMTQLHLARAKAVAAGDGAIFLATSQRMGNRRSAGGHGPVSESEHTLGDATVRVVIIPASGFIDLNLASPQILTALFSKAGGLGPGEAKTLADNVIKWRKPKNSRTAYAMRVFHAPEDLLRVEGMTRQVLDGIRDYSIAGGWLNGAMFRKTTPAQLLSMLEAATPGQGDSASRGPGSGMASLGRAGSSGGSREAGAIFRADALVKYGGRTWLRRRWVSVDPSVDLDSPFRILRTEPPRVVSEG